MKRSEISVENLTARGWKSCYKVNSNSSYPIQETVALILAGASVEFKVEVIVRTVHVKVNGEDRLWKKASDEEVAKAEAEIADAKHEAAIKKIHARNMARIRRRR